jgi:hypothetical protein
MRVGFDRRWARRDRAATLAIRQRGFGAGIPLRIHPEPQQALTVIFVRARETVEVAHLSRSGNYRAAAVFPTGRYSCGAAFVSPQLDSFRMSSCDKIDRRGKRAPVNNC